MRAPLQWQKQNFSTAWHDPQLRAMAEKIIAAQKAEIAELKKWQSEHPM